MIVHFVKMSGAGNDMILVDHRDGALAGREEEFARAACARRDGIGADGVLLIENDAGGADCFVRFFNPDGGEYGLCGNGARCVPRFVRELGFTAHRVRFRSLSGVHEGEAIGDDRARVTLAPVRTIRLDLPVDVDGAARTMDWGDIGVPHGVFWVDVVDAVPVERWGAHLRSHPVFGAEGTNVSFVQRAGPDRLRLRTFERGVEGETHACGSGSAVAATIARERGYAGDRVTLGVRSGAALVIHLPPRGAPAPPALEGPVRRVFDGAFDFAAAPAGSPASTR